MMSIDEFLEEWDSPSETLLVHTSGSTGKPKPMWVEKRRMLNSARITCDFLGLQPGDTALLCMSLDYIAGKMMMVRSIERELRLFSVKPCGHPLSNESLAHALCLDFSQKDSSHSSMPENVRLPISKQECNWEGRFPIPAQSQECQHREKQLFDFVAMVPMQVYNSLQVPVERERLSRIKHLIIGGGAIDDALAAELRKLPNAVWSTYGMTETLSHIALRRLNGAEASEWYTPFESVHVSTNEEGCLVIDAPLVCAETLVTNDIVELRTVADDCLAFRIKGRKDNVICSGGIKIQIEEVETLLRQHLDAPFMLAKKKDEKFGEIAVLITESEDLEGVEAVCRQVLPKYWIPRQYLHFDHLPLTETGKPKRAILLDGHAEPI